jgi:hypothetical protein
LSDTVAEPPADADRLLYREPVARVGVERPGWLSEAAHEIADAIQRELPELDVDDDIRASTLASTESVLHLLGRLVALGRPPGEAEPPAAAVGYVVWTERDVSASEHELELERVALELARSLGAGNALVVPLGGQLVAAWIAAPAADPTTLSQPRIDHPTGALAAFGLRARGVDGFRSTHRQALHARRVARLAGRRTGTVTSYEDVALSALASIDMDLATEFVSAHLGPLAGEDDHMRRLAATWRVYLEEHASPRHRAQRLGVHENTIEARIRTITEQLGRPPTDNTAEVLVALALARLTHRDGPRA